MASAAADLNYTRISTNEVLRFYQPLEFIWRSFLSRRVEVVELARGRMLVEKGERERYPQFNIELYSCTDSTAVY